MTWIQLHAVLILSILGSILAAIPVAANLAIPVLRKRGYIKQAAWIAAKAPLVLKTLHFAEDVIASPVQLEALTAAALALEANPSAANIAKMIVLVGSLKGAST